jgi:hypothetical protein
MKHLKYKHLLFIFTCLFFVLFFIHSNSKIAQSVPQNQFSRSDLAAASDSGKLKMTIATRSLVHKEDRISVMVNYPQVGNSKIDTELDFWARKTIETFVAGVNNLAADNHSHCSMLADYELSEASGNVFSIVFRITTETGGSFPDYGMLTFSYDLSDGRKLGLQDLFADTSGLLNFLSIYSYDTLTSELGSAFEARIKNGTAPDLVNFSFFALTTDAIIFYFPPNHVADYTLGEKKVRVPGDMLTPYNPRANLWAITTPAFKSSSSQIEHNFRQNAQSELQ